MPDTTEMELGQALAEDAIERLGRLKGSMSQDDFDAMIKNVVAIKTRHLLSMSEIQRLCMKFGARLKTFCCRHGFLTTPEN